jgi:hypothetical protein
MTEPPRSRFPALSIFLGLSGWAALFFSSHSKLISTAAAAVGAVLWTVFVGVTSKIWARVEKTIVELVGDALDVYIRDFASRYRKRYLEHLQHRHRTFDVKGLSTQGIYALEIDQVYVELTVDPTVADKASGNPIAKTGDGRHDIWTFLSSTQMTRQDFAVLGAPGSGKTTLLKHITMGLAANRGQFRELKRLPVLLFIRDHAAAIGSNPSQTIADVAEEAAKKMGIPSPAGWFGRELDRGRCLVMLDGLDEVADAALRKTVAEWVENQLQSFGANRFLVSSRPFGYRSNPLSRVTVLEVRPFSAEQGERFIANWYMANEVMSAQKDDEGVRIAAREGAADLLKRIRANPALAELAVNPLLLTMIANVHRYRSSLPGRRVELYAEICEVFLGKRQQARGMELDLTPAQKKRVLQPLAFHMMCAEKREIPLAKAVEAISGPLALVNARITAEKFLQNVEDSSGLLLERENGVYSFAHLTFQEYLAASHIVEEKLEDELVARVAIPWWHEVIRLYVALADATRIVGACIARGETSVVKLTLAVECLEEALAVRPDLRNMVESLVIKGLEDSQPEWARLAAETRLALRLRRLTRIDDDHYVDHELISCAEYQLFIDERRAAGDYRHPDHWKETHFPAGTAQEPLLGVRPSDAEEFCRWLSDRHGGEWTYQIPDRDLGAWPHVHAGYWAKTPMPKLYGISGAPLPLTPAMLIARLSKDVDALWRNASLVEIFGRLFTDLLRHVDSLLAFNYSRDFNPSFTRILEIFTVHRRDPDLFFAHYDDLNHNRVLNVIVDIVDLAFACAGASAKAFAFDHALDFDRTVRAIRMLSHRGFVAIKADYIDYLDLSLKRGYENDLDNYEARSVNRFLLLLQILELARRPPFNLWRLLRLQTRSQPNDRARVDLLDIYLDLVTLEERIDGNLPAFEGIRITKVRKAAATKETSAAKAVP